MRSLLLTAVILQLQCNEEGQECLLVNTGVFEADTWTEMGPSVVGLSGSVAGNCEDRFRQDGIYDF